MIIESYKKDQKLVIPVRRKGILNINESYHKIFNCLSKTTSATFGARVVPLEAHEIGNSFGWGSCLFILSFRGTF